MKTLHFRKIFLLEYLILLIFYFHFQSEMPQKKNKRQNYMNKVIIKYKYIKVHFDLLIQFSRQINLSCEGFTLIIF